MARTGQVVAAAGAALALLVTAPSAAAQSQIYNDFQNDGQIDPCAYSPGQLQNGLNSLPPDLQQYAPGFADQLRSGLEAPCGGGPAPASGEELTSPGLAGGGGGPSNTTRINTPAAPRPAKRPSFGNVSAPSVGAAPAGSDAPGWLLPLLAGAVALAALLFAGVMRLTGYEGFGRPLRASFSDAGGRTADAFAYARDVVRFGR
jgi:hypothetical protein